MGIFSQATCKVSAANTSLDLKENRVDGQGHPESQWWRQGIYPKSHLLEILGDTLQCNGTNSGSVYSATT